MLPVRAELLDPEVRPVGNDHAAIGEERTTVDPRKEILVRTFHEANREKRLDRQAHLRGRSWLTDLRDGTMRSRSQGDYGDGNGLNQELHCTNTSEGTMEGGG